MNAPAAVPGVVVVIPVLTFANARVEEMKTCAIVFRRQLKSHRGRARLKGFPGIAEAMGRFEREDLANVEHSRPPIEADRAPEAQIDLGFRQIPALQFCLLGQSLEDALWGGLDEEFFFN